MKTSESLKTIAPLLLKAQQTMGDVKKGSDNPFFKSTYADLNAIRAASIPVLNELGISVLQPTVVVDGKNYVETILLHTSGEFVSSQTAIVNDKGTAQAEGSGLSYARRYGLQSLLNIGAVDDDAEGVTVRKQTSTTIDAPVKKSTFRKAPVKTVTVTNSTPIVVSNDFDTTSIANGHSDVDSEESGDWI